VVDVPTFNAHDDLYDLSRLIRRYWLLIGAVSALDFIFGALFVLKMRSVDMPPTSIGALFACVSLIGIGMQAPSGSLADRWGNRRAAAFGITLWGLGQTVFGLAQATVLVIISLIFWITGSTLFAGAPTTIVVNHIRTTDKGQATVASALRSAQISRWLFSGLGAAAVLLFGDELSPATLIAVSGALMLPVAVWITRGFPQSKTRSEESGAPSLRSAIRYLRANRLAGCVIISASQSIGTSTLILGWQPLLIGGDSARSNVAGLAELIFAAACAAGAAASRFAPDKTPARWATVYVVLSAVCLWAAGSTVVLVWPGLAAAEFFVGLGSATIHIWQQSLFADDVRTTLYSMMAALSGVAVAVGDFLFGLSWEYVGQDRAVQCMAVGATLLAGSGLALEAFRGAPRSV
jgi:predicted MFS family arabinose efflux permease